MNTIKFNIPRYASDKELFPGSQLSPDDERESTTFYNDFKIAEAFGLAEVKDTFRDAFTAWKDDIKYLTELAVVTNQLGWINYERNGDLSRFYFDCYWKCYNHVYQADEEGNNIGPFTDDEVSFFSRVLD